MNFFTYINETPVSFWEKYIETGYVSVHQHSEFPLSIFAYSRKTVQENKWDFVTSKCRGIIINRDTGEIISRPFEKFHNYGSEGLQETVGVMLGGQEPVIWEKLDGFMATLYTWHGIDYIASKGSFHSIHAKWATAWLRKKFGASLGVPAGHTAVFEGLHRDLRIVVDYKERQELVLLALIDNETGEEFSPGALLAFADSRGLSAPKLTNSTLAKVHDETLVESGTDEEGYVLTWYQKGKPPFRLKLKFIEYLRLHRMVTGVSPKRIWEVLATNQSSELDEYLKQSTPWFSHFVQKWMRALNAEYQRVALAGNSLYQQAQHDVELTYPAGLSVNDFASARKTFALYVKDSPYAAFAFALLDGKNPAPIAWKMVKPMTSGKNPMVDAHNT